MHGENRLREAYGQMRRDDLNRETNRESGLIIRLFGGMAIQDARGADFLPNYILDKAWSLGR